MIDKSSLELKRRKRYIVGLVIAISLAVIMIIAQGVNGFFFVFSNFHSFRVSGYSMEPGYHNGQVVFASSIFYMLSAPKRGNVIIFHPPLHVNAACQVGAPFSANDMLMQRIVGIPGDTLSFTATTVILNGKVLNERYIAPITPGEIVYLMDVPSITLGDDQYFVLGDNRQLSLDSRCFGPVAYRNIVGEVW